MPVRARVARRTGGSDYRRTATGSHGRPLTQTLQITRHASTNLPTAYVDALNLTYDAFGNVPGITELAGTANARTTTSAYDGAFGQVTKVTDNATNATGYGYVLGDRPVRMTDPQGNVTRVTYDGFSNVRTVTDPIGRLTDHQFHFREVLAKDLWDLRSISHRNYGDPDTLMSRLRLF